ncbi:MAG: AI-2E family transporter [Campylobacterales bacterium]|nr:AI-2E family transporter [Campylobacterales bacterium]
MDNDLLKNNNFANAFYFMAFLFLVIYSISNLSSLLSSIAISFLIWFLINALASKLETYKIFQIKIMNKLSIPFAVIIIFFTIFEISGFIALSISDLSTSLVGIDEKVYSVINQLSLSFSIDIKEELNKIFQQISIAALINKALGLFSSVLSNSLQILLYVLFLLLDQRYFQAKLKALFPNEKTRKKTEIILNNISLNIKTYIYITTIISLSTGILTYLLCTFFDLEGAGLWGFMAFILNFIPTIGSIIAVSIPSLFALISFTDISYALIFIPLLISIQFLLGNIIQPKLMGDKLNISQFVVIFSLVSWGMMWGTIGMFLSIPLMVILSIILSQFESTRVLAILISSDGKILSNNK